MKHLSLLLLVAAAFLLRLAFLSQPMRLDESANYILLASQSLRTCVTVYLDANNHPLHTVLVHLSALCLGNHPWSLRMPAFVSGVLLVVATYAAFAENLRPTGGAPGRRARRPLRAAGRVFHQRAGCSLQTLLVMLLLFASAKLLREATARRWGAFGLLGVLGFYTIPTMLYYFGAMVVWLLVSAAAGDVRAPRRRFLRELVVTCACVAVIVVLLYVPFVRTSGLASLTSNRWVKSLSWTEVRGGFLGTLWTYATWSHRGLPLAMALGLGASFVVSLATFRRLSRFRVNPIALTLLVCLSMMALQRVLPPERVFLPCVPLYLGACGAGLRWVGGVIAARAKTWDARLLAGRSGPVVTGALALFVAGVPGTLVLGNGSAYQTHDQVIFSDAEPIALTLPAILGEGDLSLPAPGCAPRPPILLSAPRHSAQIHLRRGPEAASPRGASVPRRREQGLLPLHLPTGAERERPRTATGVQARADRGAAALDPVSRVR